MNDRVYLIDVLSRQNDPAASRLIEAIRAAEAGDNLPLHAALGIARMPGERTPATIDALSKRNGLLASMAEEFFPRLGPYAAAAEIVDALWRFRTRGGYQRARSGGKVSPIEARMREILDAKDHVPTVDSVAKTLKNLHNRSE